MTSQSPSYKQSKSDEYEQKQTVTKAITKLIKGTSYKQKYDDNKRIKVEVKTPLCALSIPVYQYTFTPVYQSLAVTHATPVSDDKTLDIDAPSSH